MGGQLTRRHSDLSEGEEHLMQASEHSFTNNRQGTHNESRHKDVPFADYKRSLSIAKIEKNSNLHRHTRVAKLLHER